jgi:hypothetical protein
MVKPIYALIAFIICFPASAQNLSLGMGGTGNFTRVAFNEAFNFNLLTLEGDTLLLSAENATLKKSVSLPIYARFSSKKNWWIQANYGYETWRFGLDAQTSNTPYEIEQRVNNQLAASWDNYSGTLDSLAFRNEFYELYTNNEEENSRGEINSFERVQYNRLSLLFGAVLNRKAPIKFYYGLGADLMMTSTFESYQGLVFDSEQIAYQNEILDAMPKLQSFQFAPALHFGLERQNLRIGLDFTLYAFAIYGGHESSLNNVTQRNTVDSEVIKDVRTFGVHLNYSFFNQNFNQNIDPERQAELDPHVVGRYRQKPKLFQFGAKIDFPSLHKSGWSVLDDYDLTEENDAINAKLRSENDTYLTGLNIAGEDLNDFVYIEKNDADIYINEEGNLDTNLIFTTLFFDSGNINTILKSPKFSGFIRFNPHERFSVDLNLGYQNQIYGIVAYETKNASAIDNQLNLTRRLLYQENFHEISLGINGYFQYRLNNVSQIGCHLGLNANTWIPGLFVVEQGGINDAELLEDFHDYLIEQDDAEEWNKNLNPEGDKGLFSKADYYNHTYEPSSAIAQQNSYHSDFSDYLMDTPLKRSFFEVRLGLDYYIENLKFSVYGEHSVWKQKFMYNNLLSMGMSVSMFIY